MMHEQEKQGLGKQRTLLALSLSLLLAACGGGAGNGDDAGISARLNPDGSSADSSTGSGSGSGTSTTPPASTAMVLDLGAPPSVNVGAPVTIDAAVRNARGNVTYALTGGPQGMRIDSDTGEISWTPDGLNFGAGTVFSYQVSATDADGTVSSSGSVTLANGNPPLVRSSARVPTKQNAIHIGDFNGDGENEILVTDNLSLIYTLKWDETLNRGRGDFYQEWVYPFALGKQAPIDAIDAADFNDDGILDIVVLNGDSLSVIDGDSRSLAWTATIDDARRGLALFARNIDNDDAIEIVALVALENNQQQLAVFSLPDSGMLLRNDWTSDPGEYGSAMLIADVDGPDVDAHPEIVTSMGYVFDGVSLEDQWTASKPGYGFGDQIVAADLDGDGIKEIVGLFSDSGIGEIEVFSAHLQSGLFGDLPVDRAPEPDTTRCAMAVTDQDNDGREELVVGECANNGEAGAEYLLVLRVDGPASFSIEELPWQTNDLDFNDDRRHGGFLSIALGDVDNDGSLDAVWANNIVSNEKYNALAVVDLAESRRAGALSIKRQNTTLGLFDTAFTGALDFLYAPATRYATFMANIEPGEKVVAGDKDYARSARFAFIDYDSGRVSISSQITATDKGVTGGKVMAADLFGSGYEQLIISSGYVDEESSGEVTSFKLVDFDANTTPLVDAVHGGWRPARQFNFGGIVEPGLATAFDLADLDRDGDPELTGFIGNNLFSYGFNSDPLAVPVEQLWQSVRIYGTGLDVDVDDLNDDGIPDVVHLTDAGLYIRQRDGDVLHQNSGFYENIFLFRDGFTSSSLTAMQVVDIGNDGQKEIVVSGKSDTGGVIYLLDNQGGLLGQADVDGEVTSFQRGQRDNTILVAWKEAASASDGIERAHVSEFTISADRQSITETLRSPALLGAVSPHSMNFSNDGRLLLGTRYGMYISR